MTIEGETLQDAPTARRVNLQRKIQLLFQDPAASLSPRMTVGSLLAEPLKIRRCTRPKLVAYRGAGGKHRPREQLLSRYPHH